MTPETAAQQSSHQLDLVHKARQFAIQLARVIDDRKAENIVIFDLGGISVVADYFLLASGYARVQIRAYADAVQETSNQLKIRCRSIEGYEESGWILMDYGDVVVHLMTHEARDYYRLERLWGDAPRVSWKAEQGEAEK